MDVFNLNMQSEPSRIEVYKLFDQIAPRYDIFNKVSSLGLDVIWRCRVAGMVKYQKKLKVLDVATGTADLLLSLFSAGCDISSAVGLDMSAKMLGIADRKIRRRNLTGLVSLKQADAMNIPFNNDSFNLATCAFGIRNLADTAAGLKQMYRILKPAGKVLILEFSLPRNRILKKIYLLYLRHIVPLLGRIITGDSCPYRYLNKTVEAFPNGEDFCRFMQDAGFINVQAVPMTFGVVNLYQADKPTKSTLEAKLRCSYNNS